MKKHVHSRFIFIFLIFWTIMLMPETSPCQDSTAVIQVEFRKASEFLPIIKGMLSGDGKISVDTRTNSIVVTDDMERIDKIKSLISRLDVPPRQVRIRVKFEEELFSSDRSIAGSGSISSDHFRLNTGRRKKDGISAQVSGRNIRRNQRSEYFINVLSGSPAYIMAGENIVYREKWNHFIKKYSRHNTQITIQRIDTGFDVKPVLAGDSAKIEIIPRISYRAHNGRKNIVRFTEAATTISVPLDQWVQIGSADKNNNEVIKEILEYGTSNNSSSLSIFLMVEE